MKKILVLGFFTFLSLSASAHVCQNLKEVKGFSYSILFNNTIMNTKSIDYYTFSSECKKDCLYRNLKNKKIRYSTTNNNISIFDSNSVGTITIDSTDKEGISGYLTCSSTAKRNYIPIPVGINSKKVTLDLQTEDGSAISRMLNTQGYTKSEYSFLVNSLNRLTPDKEREIGFTNYRVIYNRSKNVIKISDLSSNGDFILIIEKLK